MKRAYRQSLPPLFFLAVGCAGQAVPLTAQEAPTRVVLFIGDGVGTSYWTAAALAKDSLAVQRFRVTGLVKTESSDSKVTDSAAGATAYATGVRTYNGAIGVGPDSVALKTVLEEAKERGMATGLVATSRITHATPASFAAHVPSRASEVEIAAQLAAAHVDVMLGGGRAWFDGRYRPDSVDLLTDIRTRGAYLEGPEELEILDPDTVKVLFGLFEEDHMPAAADRSPTLPQMTAAALAVLDHNPKGFFLMVEGSQPDWRGHGNELLAAVTREMLDFDAAIGVALDYQQKHPETLVVVVADHETGGLAVQLDPAIPLALRVAADLDTVSVGLDSVIAELHATPAPEHTTAVADSGSLARLESTSMQLREAALVLQGLVSLDSLRWDLAARYTTGSHTAAMTPLFASGPAAERFGGIIENWRVGKLLMEAVRR